jgi:predicted Na+-dependent transporter
MLVIPFILNILLSRAVEIPLMELARQLLFTVFIPTMLGQAIRMIFPTFMERAVVKRVDKDLPSVLIGLTVYLSLAPQASKLLNVSAARLLILVLAAFLVHGALLGSGYLVSRKLLAIDRPKSLSVSFVCSQKSIALGVPI